MPVCLYSKVTFACVYHKYDGRDSKTLKIEHPKTKPKMTYYFIKLYSCLRGAEILEKFFKNVTVNCAFSVLHDIIYICRIKDLFPSLCDFYCI